MRAITAVVTAIQELATCPLDAETQGVAPVESKANQLLQDLRRDAPNSAHMAE